MGLGKTIQALYWCYKTKKARPIIVVCPAAVKYNWQREASKHLDMLSHVLEGRKATRIRRGSVPILILNYDILSKWVPYLRELDPRVVILDECHAIKNLKSQRYEATKELCEGVKHVIAISGTPLTNRPAELWPTLNILLPHYYNSFFAFAFEFCRPRRMPWGGWNYGGAKNLAKLHEQLKEQCMIRRLKRQVLKELPDKVRTVVPVPLRDRGEYERASNDFIGWLKQKSPGKAKRAMKAEAVTRIGYLLRLVARLKVRAVYDWVDNFLEESDDKLVIFTRHTPMIRALEKHYGKKRIGWVTVDGGVTGRNRLHNVDRFRHDPDTRLFFGNIKAAGTGIDGLQEACSTALFVDLPWTPGDLVQAEDRLHRNGQKGATNIYYLIALNTIEEYLCELLQTKQKILEQTLDGAAESEEDTELSVLDTQEQLINHISK